jgi:hypothetical protein
LTRLLEIPPSLIGLQANFQGRLVFAQLEESSMEVPGAEPVLVAGDGKGDRCYLVAGEYWYEYVADFQQLAACASGQVGDICREMRLIHYGTMPQPFWRLLYQSGFSRETRYEAPEC